MKTIACLLTVALVGESPAPLETTAAVECSATDKRCQATRFEQKAERAATPKMRAVYLHAAQLSHLDVFDDTGDVRALCAARRAFDRSLAVEALPAKQRASFEATRAALESREKQRSVRCGPTRRPKTEAPALATGDPAKSREQPPLLASRESPASVAADPNEDALLPVRARASSSAVRPVADPQRVAEQVPGRPLLIAGGVTLSIGLTLGGVAIYTGRRALAAYQAGLDLRAEVQGAPDAAMLARDADLAAEYRRLGPAALATAIGSGVAVIAGVVMAGVGGRRRTRAGRTAWTPVPGGLALHVRF